MRLAAFLLTILACAAARAGTTLDEALRALRTDDPAVRVRATNVLAQAAGPQRATAARALEASLFDPAPPVRRASVNALVALDARWTAGAVVKLLEVERDVHVLPAVLLAAGRLRAAGALGRIVPFASHPAVGVRAAAITAAGDLGGPEARRLILNSLQMAGAEDSAWVVRSAALLALARAGRPEDLEAARRAFVAGHGERHWLARSAWARIVAALHPRPRPELTRLIMDEDERVAVTAAAGMARAGLGDLVVLHLTNSQSRIRCAAIGGVRQAKIAGAYPRLRRMARWDGSRKVRWAAVVALFEVGDPDGDELMLDALRSKEPAIWMEAHARLARRTGAEHGRDVDAWRKALRRRRPP